LDLQYLRDSATNVNYLKLHGSLDWWKRDDGKIVISSGKPMFGEKLIDQIMIYPIYEKYISREPFYSLYTAFRKNLFKEQIVIVIGYSFRDISINNALLDNLQTTESSRLIISAKSDSVKQRISKIFGLNKRVSLIDKYFGEGGFVDELKNKLKR
jgi:SIR2-like domain